MANAHVAIGPFAGLTFLACYLSGKIKVFDRRGHVAKLCLLFLPILVAVLIGISRVDDYWPERSSEYLSLLSFASTFFPYPFDDNGSKHYLYNDVTAFLNRDLQEWRLRWRFSRVLWVSDGGILKSNGKVCSRRYSIYGEMREIMGSVGEIGEKNLDRIGEGCWVNHHDMEIGSGSQYEDEGHYDDRARSYKGVVINGDGGQQDRGREKREYQGKGKGKMFEEGDSKWVKAADREHKLTTTIIVVAIVVRRKVPVIGTIEESIHGHIKMTCKSACRLAW
ncbi:hypothetical protein F2Q69_00007814 [Brassica cretica]|uniref:Uncharacterized protein n=1 Tax=Brassica cretica TaxID=69181 RepID=A0A8S9PD59_BRACR|nr:hypothetical protein F2Q69_00007814 [Brassica cretica]